MVHPCCGMSLQKAARHIAIIDLVICVFNASIRLVLYDIQEYTAFYESPVLETLDASESFHINLTVKMNQIEDPHVPISKEEPVGKISQYTKVDTGKTNSEFDHESANFKPIGKNSTVKPVLPAHNLKQDSLLAEFVAVTIVSFVIIICYIILEIWLCRLLLTASSNRDSFVCKRWFWIRVALTVFGLIFSIFGMVTMKFIWIEWLLEPITLYRAYELFVVNEFRKEIGATSGIIKQRG